MAALPVTTPYGSPINIISPAGRDSHCFDSPASLGTAYGSPIVNQLLSTVDTPVAPSSPSVSADGGLTFDSAGNGSMPRSISQSAHAHAHAASKKRGHVRSISQQVLAASPSAALCFVLCALFLRCSFAAGVCSAICLVRALQRKSWVRLHFVPAVCCDRTRRTHGCICMRGVGVVLIVPVLCRFRLSLMSFTYSSIQSRRSRQKTVTVYVLTIVGV